MLLAQWTSTELILVIGAVGTLSGVITTNVILIIKQIQQGRATQVNADKIDVLHHAVNSALDKQIIAAENTGAIEERNRADARTDAAAKVIIEQQKTHQ